MYGLVNRGVEELIRTQFDDDTWERIVSAAQVADEVFISMDCYEDDVTRRLVDATAGELGVTFEAVLETFGRFWIEYSGRTGYGALFEMAGDSLPELLNNLDAMHERVAHSFPDLRAPRFSCTELSDDSLLLRYESSRDWLAPMVVGLMRGLGDRMGMTIDIDHTVRRADGAGHDEFVICYARAACAA